MEIQSDERFSGIVFDNTKQAVMALALRIREFRQDVQYTGPEELAGLLDHPERLLQYDGFRLQGFLDDLGKYGHASREYGSHIASVISDLRLSIRPISMTIWTRETLLQTLSSLGEEDITTMIENSMEDEAEYSRNSVTSGILLEVTPNSVNSISYEDRIVDILNSLTTELSSYFGDKQYHRILRSTSLIIKGSENDILDAAKMIEEGPGIWGTDFGHTTTFRGKINYIPDNKGGSLPAKTWSVNLSGSRYHGESTIGLRFSHPKDLEGVHYPDYKILCGARDQFKVSLEGRLGKITGNTTPLLPTYSNS